MTSVQIDCGALACPGPLVAISKTMRMMNTGETLEVSATDPAFCEDVRAWCEMTGNQLLAMEQRDAGCRAIIRKSQAKEE